MGIYIKGMKMPSNCCECPVNMEVCKRGYKYLLEHPDLYDKRADDCPIVSVPPHMRLIDADALEMERRTENAKRGWHDSFAVVFNGDPYYEATYDCTEQFKELVNNAPTIIPAEEDER